MKSILQNPQQIQEPQLKTPTFTETLNISAKQLEELMISAGATVTHPIPVDPIAHKNGKVLAIWTE